jgi:DNA-binding transcriptional LysR family regulator
MLRRVTLHQLRLFAALARTMNMTRAAEELHMTPSAFSIQIKQLSDSLGVALHEQAGKKLFLTEAGRAVAGAAREMIERLDLLGMEIADLQGFTRGTLRVAMITTARYFATRLIGDFCRAYPNITFELEVVNRDQILQRMRENLDDLYIMGLVPDDLDVAAFPVAENPLVVIAPAEHPLCGEKDIAPEKLAREPFILREAGSGTRQAVERFFDAHGVSPPVRMSLGSDETIKQVVAAGLGLTALSRHVLALDAASGRLRELDVRGFPIHRQWYVAHLAAKKLSPPARAFLEMLKAPPAQTSGRKS